MRFKDVFSIIGPSMIGPSSSHTAGAIRLGRVARQLLGEMPERAEIVFYGSFAETYQGHGTDLAIVGGLLDFDTDDRRIPDALELAEQGGIAVSFQTSANPASHPNTVKMIVRADDREVVVVGSSIGGGNIEITSVNRFDIKFTGMYPAIVIAHRDRPGLIADVTELLRRDRINIGHMDVDRHGRSGEAMTVIEVDNLLADDLLKAIMEIDTVLDVKKIDLAERGSI